MLARESIIVIDIMTIIGMVHGEGRVITGAATETEAMVEVMAEAMVEVMDKAMAVEAMVAVEEIRDTVNRVYR